MSKYVTLENLKAFLEESDGRYVYRKSGFGLSSNDFEDEYKNRIKSIEDGAEKNRIMEIRLNDILIEPEKNRAVNIKLPEATKDDMDKLLELKFDIEDDSEYATEKDINDLFVNQAEDGTKDDQKPSTSSSDGRYASEEDIYTLFDKTGEEETE